MLRIAIKKDEGNQAHTHSLPCLHLASSTDSICLERDVNQCWSYSTATDCLPAHGGSETDPRFDRQHTIRSSKPAKKISECKAKQQQQQAQKVI